MTDPAMTQHEAELGEDMASITEADETLASKFLWCMDLGTHRELVESIAAYRIACAKAERAAGWDAAVEAAADAAAQERVFRLKERDSAPNKAERRDHDSMAIECVHIEYAIRALAGKVA